MLKAQTYRSAKWLAAVREIPYCVGCRRWLPVQAAHANINKGIGLKTDDCATAALCLECHAELDNGKLYSRDERRAMMDRYIVLTVIELARAGKIKI